MTIATVVNNTNASRTSERRRKCIKIFAKLGIASGLLSLLASVAIYGLEDRIHNEIDSESSENQYSFRLKEINEYVYHTNLKYATLQKLCRFYKIDVNCQ